MPETPNYLADELRRIIQDAVDTEAHPVIRERLTRLADEVERLGDQPVEVDASTELTANFGLEPEQEIRDRALERAIAWVGHQWVGGTRDRNGILDVADTLAAYITDGSKP